MVLDLLYSNEYIQYLNMNDCENEHKRKGYSKEYRLCKWQSGTYVQVIVTLSLSGNYHITIPSVFI